MQYLGGKQRLAKLFAPVLDEALALGSGRLIEPFVGGFNILPSLAYARSALCADIHPGLIALYQALQSKVYVPPENLSEDRYQQLRLSSNWDDPNTAFAAFGCSFGGKEWGGYARNAKGDNYALRARKSLLKKAKSMQGVEFLHTNYRTLWANHGDVVYADPPYANTTGYATGSFDHDEFYEWCEQRSREGARVFVSEFTVPDRRGWSVVWKIDRHVMVDGRTQGNRTRTDLLIEVRT